MTYGTIIQTGDLAPRLGDPRWVVFDCRHTLTDPEAGRRSLREGARPDGAVRPYGGRSLRSFQAGGGDAILSRSL